jgi:HAMP domain-containing protein
MISWKAFLVAFPVAVAGAWGVASGQSRLESARQEMARLEVAGRFEGESFMKTLQGAHADRQLEVFDRRRELALELARARRDQMLGVLALVASALLLAAASVIRRIAAEVAEGSRLVSGRSGDGDRR